MCYGDKTWCAESKECISECDRRTTDEILDKADKWWNRGYEDKSKWTSAPFSVQSMKNTTYCPGYKEKS